MFLKALMIIGALIALGIFVSRGLRALGASTRDEPRGRRLDTQDLVKCGACGIYIPAGRTCDCGDQS